MRDYITVSLEERYPRASHDDLEDAVSEAMLWLVDYWLSLDRSMTDNGWSNWHGARDYGLRKAAEVLRDITLEHLETPSITDVPKGGVSELNTGQYDAMPHHGRRDEDWTDAPDDTSDEDDLVMAEELLREVVKEEWGASLTGYLSGQSVRDEAEATGVSKSQVARDREAAMRKLRRWARDKGLYAE